MTGQWEGYLKGIAKAELLERWAYKNHLKLWTYLRSTFAAFGFFGSYNYTQQKSIGKEF